MQGMAANLAWLIIKVATVAQIRARIVVNFLQVEVGDFIACPTGSKVHDLRNTRLNTLK